MALVIPTQGLKSATGSPLPNGEGRTSCPPFGPECLNWSLGQDLFAEIVGREGSSDAGGGVGLGEQGDPAGRDVQAGLEGGDELHELALLGLAGLGLAEVADKADAEAGAVDVVGAGD